MSSPSKFVRKKEFRARLNIGNTKFWQLQKAGVIPPPIRLPGLNGTPGRTCFWTDATTDQVVAALAGSLSGAQLTELAEKNDPFRRSVTA
jgi:predicted DNA-binding transcriptional regulator AlpA